MAFEVEYLTGLKNTPGYRDLRYTPLIPSEVAVDPVGGPAQVVGEDYLVIGNRLYWVHDQIPKSDIKGVIGEGYEVTLRVMYERE